MTVPFGSAAARGGEPRVSVGVNGKEIVAWIGKYCSAGDRVAGLGADGWFAAAARMAGKSEEFWGIEERRGFVFG